MSGPENAIKRAISDDSSAASEDSRVAKVSVAPPASQNGVLCHNGH